MAVELFRDARDLGEAARTVEVGAVRRVVERALDVRLFDTPALVERDPDETPPLDLPKAGIASNAAMMISARCFI